MKEKFKHIINNNNFLSLLGQGLFAIVGFGAVFLFTRSYSLEDYGVWVLYITAFTMVDMLRMGFTGTAVVRFLSGAEKNEKESYLGSSWVVAILFTVTTIVIFFGVNFIFKDTISKSGYDLFFRWFPLVYIFVLPYNYGAYVLQAKGKFGKIIILKLLNQLTFFCFIIYNFYVKMPIEFAIYAHIVCSFISGFVAIITGWSGIQYLLKYKKSQIHELYQFGKFSGGTLVGSSLLRTSDIFIIGALMGAASAAFYSVSLKLIELFEIIMRSFVQVALPLLSKASMRKNEELLLHIFYKYTGVLTLIFIPMTIVCFLMSDFLIVMFAGQQYAESAVIFRIFLIYILFLPLDRLSGVTLDSINLPKANLIKVFVMLLANVVGDYLVIYFFNTEWSVSVITITTTLVGIFTGMYFLRKETDIIYGQILPVGFKEIRKLASNFLTKKELV